MLEAGGLLEVAEFLIAGSDVSPARCRRAVSTAYYALFHHLVATTTDLLVGAGARDSERYGLVYRSFDHRDMKAACRAQGTRSAPLRGCAENFVQLQARRHAADYDPRAGFTPEDARNAVEAARQAIASLTAADPEERALFLTRLRFRPRG